MSDMNDLYHEVILAEARAPRNRGVLVEATVESQYTNASCGDTAHVMVQLDAAKERILDSKWDGAGCIISQASLSIVTELVKGKTVQEVQEFTAETILVELGIEEISPARVKCVTLGLQAIQKALSQGSSE